jgi:hypothetical protein
LKVNNSFEKIEEKKPGKILKKNRPMYKRSKIKEDFERCYIHLKTDKTLAIHRVGENLISRKLRILKDQKVVLEKQLQYKNEVIPLQSLPSGLYNLQIGSGSQFASIELEMP